MCLGIPGEIVAILPGDLATVAVAGVEREISISLVKDDGVGVGDWVLVHVGFALATIDAAEAATTLDQIQKLGKPFADEMAAYSDTAIL
ncbi:MAG: HypC/HybG/HupF family hydrogenase formation chaperone [Actinomycetia bacterium]|nr:HypC/HybG/HupF family hydrogenase formation chaperone [Actinomycetes bacterium]